MVIAFGRWNAKMVCGLGSAPNSAASRGVERVDAVPGAMNHLRPIHSTAATNYAD